MARVSTSVKGGCGTAVEQNQQAASDSRDETGLAWDETSRNVLTYGLVKSFCGCVADFRKKCAKQCGRSWRKELHASFVLVRTTVPKRTARALANELSQRGSTNSCPKAVAATILFATTGGVVATTASPRQRCPDAATAITTGQASRAIAT
eukprot:5023886-Pleurochrysis_carterae.AAC.2